VTGKAKHAAAVVFRMYLKKNDLRTFRSPQPLLDVFAQHDPFASETDATVVMLIDHFRVTDRVIGPTNFG